MTFSAYQIESMLEDFHKNILPPKSSSMDILLISDDALIEAKQNCRIKKEAQLGNINPKTLRELVEDKELYDPIVDYVQQSRAGRFVIPNFIPKNPPPKFPLVRESSTEKINTIENNNKFDLSIESIVDKRINLEGKFEEEEEEERTVLFDKNFSESNNAVKIFNDFDEDYSSSSKELFKLVPNI